MSAADYQVRPPTQTIFFVGGKSNLYESKKVAQFGVLFLIALCTLVFPTSFGRLFSNYFELCIDCSAVKPPIKDTKDKLKVLLYAHSIENHLRKRTTALQRPTNSWSQKVSCIH